MSTETYEQSNRIIQSLWIGNRLSTLEHLCISSYLQNDHSFHLYSYDIIENVPKGTIIKDANQIIPHNKLFKDSHGGFSSFADWFRYQLLYLKGGWWVDMDTVCIQHFDIHSDYCFASEKTETSKRYVNNGIIKSPENAEFLQDMLEYIEKKMSNMPIDGTLEWGEFGPSLLHSTLENYESKGFIQPEEVFCPINWNEISKLICKPDFILDESSIYSIHFWNEMWRLGRLDKDAIYHPESVIEKMKQKYMV